MSENISTVGNTQEQNVKTAITDALSGIVDGLINTNLGSKLTPQMIFNEDLMEDIVDAVRPRGVNEYLSDISSIIARQGEAACDKRVNIDILTKVKDVNTGKTTYILPKPCNDSKVYDLGILRFLIKTFASLNKGETIMPNEYEDDFIQKFRIVNPSSTYTNRDLARYIKFFYFNRRLESYWDPISKQQAGLGKAFTDYINTIQEQDPTNDPMATNYSQDYQDEYFENSSETDYSGLQGQLAKLKSAVQGGGEDTNDSGNNPEDRFVDDMTEVIDIVLSQPTIFKISTLDTNALNLLFSYGNDDIGDLRYLRDTKISTDTKSINKTVVKMYLLKIMYVRLTQKNERYINSIVSNDINLATQNIPAAIQNDTDNYKSLNPDEIQKYPGRRYIYVKRLLDILNNITSDPDTYDAIKFGSEDDGVINSLLSVFNQDYVNDMITFVTQILPIIEDTSRNKFKFHPAIDKYILERSKKYILTYVKVRNDDNDDYNRRFDIKVNLPRLANKESLNTMYLGYNDVNEPYYVENKEKKWEPTEYIKAKTIVKSKRIEGGAPGSNAEAEAAKNERKGLATSKRDVMYNVSDAGSAGIRIAPEKYRRNYVFGKFTQMMMPNWQNSYVSERMSAVIDQLVNGNPVFIIGYGASGAGKTSSLVYFNKGNTQSEKDGVLMHICNNIAKRKFNDDTTQYKYITVCAKEFYTTDFYPETQSKSLLDKPDTRRSPREDSINVEFEFDDSVGSFVLSTKYNHTINHKYRTQPSTTTPSYTSATEAAEDAVANSRILNGCKETATGAEKAMVTLTPGDDASQDPTIAPKVAQALKDAKAVTDAFCTAVLAAKKVEIAALEERLRRIGADDQPPSYQIPKDTVFDDISTILVAVKAAITKLGMANVPTPTLEVDSFVASAKISLTSDISTLKYEVNDATDKKAKREAGFTEIDSRWQQLINEAESIDQSIAQVLQDKDATPTRSNIIFVQQAAAAVEGEVPGKKAVFLNRTTLGEVMIYLIDDDRFVKATTNNPNSSRSHTLIFVKFYSTADRTGEPLRLVVGDFAGVENVFNCQDPLTIKNFLNVKRDNTVRPFYSEEIVDRRDAVDGGSGAVSGGKLVQPEDKCKQYVGLAEEVYVFGDDERGKGLGLPFLPNSMRSYPNNKNLEDVLKKAKLDDKTKIGEKVIFENRYDEMIRTVVNGLAVLTNYDGNYITKLLTSDQNEIEYTFEKNRSNFIKDNECINIITKLSSAFKKGEGNKAETVFKEYFEKALPVPTEDKPTTTYVYKKELDAKKKELTDAAADLEKISKEIGDNITSGGKYSNFKNGSELNIQVAKLNESLETYKIDEKCPTAYTENAKITSADSGIVVIQENDTVNLNNLKNAINPEDKGKPNPQAMITALSEYNIKNDDDIKKLHKIYLALYQPDFYNAIMTYLNRTKTVESDKLLTTKYHTYMKELGAAINNYNKRDIDTFLNNSNIINKSVFKDYETFIDSLKAYINKKVASDESGKMKVYIEKLNNIREFLNKLNPIVVKLKGVIGEVADIPTVLATFIKNNQAVDIDVYTWSKEQPVPTLEKKGITKILSDGMQEDWDKIKGLFPTIDDSSNLFEAFVQYFIGDSKDDFANVLAAFPGIYDITKGLLVETGCRKISIEKVCENRRSEGYFINDSLSKIRDVINKLMVEKTSDVPNVAPQFVDFCKKMYCPSGTNCFALSRNNDATTSVIFNEIFYQFYTNISSQVNKKTKDMYKELIVSVFCVLNISKRANNPPPIPYIDINDFKGIVFHPKFARDFKDPEFQTKLIGAANIVRGDVEYFEERVKSIPKDIVYESFFKLLNKLDEATPLAVQESATKLINLIDNSNAASAIGTLEFVDKISKFNSVNVICTPDDDQLKKVPDLLDIVDAKNKIGPQPKKEQTGGKSKKKTPASKGMNIDINVSCYKNMIVWVFLAFVLLALSVYITNVLVSRKMVPNSAMHTGVVLFCIYIGMLAMTVLAANIFR